MTCATCGRTNPADAGFCGGCGTGLAPVCPSCGATCANDARFCNACGARVRGDPAEKAIARKLVTVVFADLIGSMSLQERLDAESSRRVMDRYHRAMTTAVELHGGRVVQLLGDGVLAAFGVPRVAEDDAIRAVRAAVGMQRAFRELVREPGGALADIGLRVAVNTGEVVVSNDETAVIGDPTNVAARLQSEARDGDVIIGEGTQRLVAEHVTLSPLGSFSLRGRAEAVNAFRVVSLERPASVRATAFVGREAELQRLLAVFEAAVALPGARLAVLLGSPGLGKSRLLAELERRAGERATVLSARCDAAGGATFAPIAEALRTLLRIEEGAGDDALREAIDAVLPGDEAERSRVAAGIGALFWGAPSTPEETFFAVRRLVAALAAKRPVVLAIDDLHWAEPLLLDLIEHLVQWSSGVPLLVLGAARPELRELRASLVTPGVLGAEVVTLGGLDAGASMQLAAGVLGATELPAALVGRVLTTSEGNPLFLGELVRMLVQDGTLRREGDRWVTTVEVAKLDMPATIQVLLAARIERLRAEDRAVLERAAVIGRVFSRTAVAHLLPGVATDLDARLETLRRSELIEPDTGWYLGEPALRFHHVLIRDAAYRRLLKETRAELHERLADWITARGGESSEREEALGWHLEQAHAHLRELGPLDERGRKLGERAAQHLGTAGRRALAREDLSLAAALLGRAIAAVEPGHGLRAELALDWCEALLALGEVADAAGAIAELERAAGDSKRLHAWHACFAGQLAALADPQSLRLTADRVAAAAEILTTLQDAAGEAKAHSVHAGVLARLGAIGASEVVLDKALAAARQARDRRRANAVLAGAPVAALWGPSPVTRASGRCLDVVRVLRITQGAPTVEAVALRCQAVLETLRGRGEAARRMIAAARRMVEELGISQQVLEADVFAGLISLLEGDAAAAETSLRSAYEGLRSRGLGIDAARAAALLSRTLLTLGRIDEAEAVSRESEALAGDDLKAAIAWRGVRAEALARRGEAALALELASAAVAIAAETDALLDHADARMALAAALRAAGREAEADREERRALELWDAKGAIVLTERARRDRKSLARPDAAENVSAAAPGEAGALRRRGPRSNAATAELGRLEAAVEARDEAAIAELFEKLVETVHHPLGVTWNREGAITNFGFLLQNQAFTYRHEPLAILGDRLALCRQHLASAGLVRGSMDVGPFDSVHVWLSEVDENGRRIRSECFAPDQLAVAIARLYESYAELQPEGRLREAARNTARAVSYFLSVDLSHEFAAIADDDFTFIDHRLLGFGTIRGIENARAALMPLERVADDVVVRVDEILALEPEAVFLRSVTSGRDRASGGHFERPVLQIRTFAPGGRMARTELFDQDGEAEALARFDELTSSTVQLQAIAQRRVQPNFAIEHVRRLDAAWASGDDRAFGPLFSPRLEVIHHPTGRVFDHEATVVRFRQATGENGEVGFRHEPLASLGEALALCRLMMSSPRIVLGALESGAFEIEYFVLVEADSEARSTRIEVFPADQLSAAVVRLYERHAQLRAGDSTAATRAAAVAGVVRMDLDAIGPTLDPNIAFTDFRRLGLGSARGAERYIRGLRSMVELAPDAVPHSTEMLIATERALLLRRLTLGTDRTSGGAFEFDLLMLWIFGDDGRITHVELFDAEKGDQALARVDTLTFDPKEDRAAWAKLDAGSDSGGVAAAMRAFANALAQRDWEKLAACCAPGLVVHDHRRLGWEPLRGPAAYVRALRGLIELAPDTRMGLDHVETSEHGFLVRTSWTGTRDGGRFEEPSLMVGEIDQEGRMARLDQYEVERLDAARARHAEIDAAPDPLRIPPNAASRASDRSHALARAGQHSTRTLLATNGDRLCLHHNRFKGSPESGELEIDTLSVTEIDEEGRIVAVLLFDVEDRRNAAVEMLERYMTREGAERMPASQIAFLRALHARDLPAMRAAINESMTFVDHRHTGLGRLGSADDYLSSVAALIEETDDFASEVLYHVASEPYGSLSVGRMFGTLRGGGPFESVFVRLNRYGTHGVGVELFEIHDLERAKELFAELSRQHAALGGDSSEPAPNAATRTLKRWLACIETKDWHALSALFAPEMIWEDRRPMFRITADRDGLIKNVRLITQSGFKVADESLLATAGDRLALTRSLFRGPQRDAPVEVEALQLLEVDEQGHIVAVIAFDPADREAADQEMKARAEKAT